MGRWGDGAMAMARWGYGAIVKIWRQLSIIIVPIPGQLRKSRRPLT